MQWLNLGILAHVDAGKTSLTERLLLTAGVIDELGSVDAGNTQTDSLALERRRGITIKSAVVSFALGDTTVNLIDTPGHPDFIAEVERVLNVLDGAVLVVSGVEGVQPQTRVLMRTLKRLRIPTLVFVNKLDRPTADFERALHGLDGVMPAHDPRVELLAEHDEALLHAWVEGETPGLHGPLREQSRRGLVHAAFGGSAITGAGVGELMERCRRSSPPHTATRKGRPTRPCSRSSAARSPTCGCAPAPCACATGCRPGRSRGSSPARSCAPARSGACGGSPARASTAIITSRRRRSSP